MVLSGLLTSNSALGLSAWTHRGHEKQVGQETLNQVVTPELPGVSWWTANRQVVGSNPGFLTVTDVQKHILHT